MLRDVPFFYFDELDLEGITGGELAWVKAAFHASNEGAKRYYHKAILLYKCTGGRRVLADKYMDLIRQGAVYLASIHSIAIVAYVPVRAKWDSNELAKEVWRRGLRLKQSDTGESVQLCLI